MSKVNKYRLWSKVAQQIVGWDQVQEKPHLIWDDMYVAMQFIGLKDKSGVEIYADDLLKSESGKIVSIVFWEGSFCIDSPDRPLVSESSIIFLNTCKFWKVIGNIHQDSHLLEGGE